MKNTISITAYASISALGSTSKAIWNAYLDNAHRISTKDFDGKKAFVAQLCKEDKAQIEALRQSDSKYKDLDNAVLYALFASRQAVKKAGWNATNSFGINLGSSRGATSLFEKYHKEFLEKGKSSTLSSPTTTLGNISSWIAHDLQTNGPQLSHSITCSTALHSLLNGVAWLQSGMATKFLVGGSEAPLTNFTIAQMKALKVYASQASNTEYPCRAFDLKKNKNTMVLGEGASVFCLESGEQENSIATIEGIGFATELLTHNVSITKNAQCFQDSMKMALQNTNFDEIDAIVMHTPGTQLGDQSEVNAIDSIFGKSRPFLTTNKWKLGHTFGASGGFSLELALMMLEHQKVIAVPFAENQAFPKQIKKIVVNAVGFGGNAVSILISK